MTKFIAICSHPNAGTNINGVTFEHADGAARTAPIEEALAAQFRGSPDFEVIEFVDHDAAARAAAEKKAEADAKKAVADAKKKAEADAKSAAESKAKADAEAATAAAGKSGNQTGETDGKSGDTAQTKLV